MTTKIKKRVATLRNEFHAAEAAEFNNAASRREVEKSYALAKEQANLRRTKTKNKVIPGLFPHFKGHFTHPTPTEMPEILRCPPESAVNVDYQTTAPTRAEIVEIITKAKNGESSLDIPMDLLKFYPRILKHCNCCLNSL